MRKHWYLITVFSCPICGRERKHRERKYGRKPKKTLEWFDYYDYCQERW